MHYIDSNVFIYPIIYTTEMTNAKMAKEFLLKVARGKMEAYTATITWDEIAWIIRKLFGAEASVDESRKFINFPNLRLLAVKKTTVMLAQDLAEKYRLKPRDAIHAATAIERGITSIVSYDKDFDQVKELTRTEP
mgnify:FL=1